MQTLRTGSLMSSFISNSSNKGILYRRTSSNFQTPRGVFNELRGALKSEEVLRASF